MEARYLRGAADDPDKAVYRYCLGLLYHYKDPDLAVRYFQEGVKVEPRFAPAWDALAFTAEGQGKFTREPGIRRRNTTEAWPENSRYAMRYVASWMAGEFPALQRIAMEFAEQFPDQAIGLLETVARRAPTLRESRQVYEILRQKYLPAAANRLTPLFCLYLQEDAAEALALARAMARLRPDDPQWPPLVAYAEAVAGADRMIATGQAAEAVAALNAVVLPSRSDRRVLEVVRAQTRDAAGEGGAAYSELLKSFANRPSDLARGMLFDLGKRLGKDAARVDSEVFAQFSLSARPGVPFSTTSYASGKPVTLDRQKGKVFLLNFWYPMCGPCRAEFLFLQSILSRYQDRGFEIVAVNGHPLEDAWVKPLMEGWRLGFTAVRGGDAFAESYGVQGFPASFLFGADGRIYARPDAIDSADARRELELQVEALLPQVRR